jgi:SulP family sulfate permease
VLRIESGLYFANADNVRAHVLQAASADGVRAVVLDAETIPFIDVTASQMLADLGEELAQRGTQLVIARDVGQVRDVLRHVVDSPALERVYPTVTAAVDAVTGGPTRPTRRRRRDF